MKTGIRLMAVALIASLLAGAVPPQAAAQAQTAPPAQQQAQMPGMMQEQMKQRDDSSNPGLANLFNVFYVPGKGIVCGVGGLFAFMLMAATLGSAHKDAAGAIREGCSGPWTLSGDDLKPIPQEDFYQPKPVIEK